MRKVEFQYWIYPVKKDISQGRSVDTGTGHFSEPQEGLFHGWGYQVHEDANNIVADSVALVECCKTGQMYNVTPSRMKFITPPEVKNVVKCAGCEGKGKIPPMGEQCHICKGEGVVEYTLQWMNDGKGEDLLKSCIFDEAVLAVRMYEIDAAGKRLYTLFSPFKFR
jgi:hypothetical protein